MNSELVYGPIALVVLSFCNLYGQDLPRREVDPERLADDIFPVQDLDVNYEEGYENLLQILAHPLDLNRASEEQFRSLLILREDQVQSLMVYRKTYGPFISLYELQSVPYIDLATCYKLAPLLVVNDPHASIDRNMVNRIVNEDSYLIARYEQTVEKKKGPYVGSPAKIYTRFRSSRPGDFSFGLTAEKDAGEALLWDPSRRYYGMDYYSFHGQLLNKGKLTNLIAGDFQAQFGQGLLLGGGFGMGKAAESITTIRRSNLGFLPYTSVNEFGFLRGCAISYSLSSRLTIHALASALRRDALTHPDSTEEQSTLVSSFALTGYHRTELELASRKKIRETNLGLVIQYKLKALDAGVILIETQYDAPLVRTPAVYNKFYFSGIRNTDLSFFLNWTRNNMTFFSEAAMTFGHGLGMTAGVLAGLSSRLELSMLYRNFARDFYTFYSNALSENTAPQNETGYYWGLKFSPSKKFWASGYIDLFRFPWLRYRDYSPGDGSEWMVRLNYQPARRVLMYVQAREEVKARNLGSESTLYYTGEGTKLNFWINCDYALPSLWSFKTRAQFNRFALQGKVTRGMALIQDASFVVGRFSITGRYALFATDTYDNRIYSYEPDAALAFSFPAYDGLGIRRLVMVRYHASQRVDVWIRWAGMRYSNQETIGSGAETISGSERNDVKLQLRIRL